MGVLLTVAMPPIACDGEVEAVENDDQQPGKSGVRPENTAGRAASLE